MIICVDIVFKDWTTAHVEDAKVKDFMIQIDDELTLVSNNFSLYKRQGNVICGELIDDEVRSIEINILNG